MSLTSSDVAREHVTRSVFDGQSVVLAVLGKHNAAGLVATLEQQGASVQITSSMTEARSCAARLLPCATVLVDPPGISESIHAGLRVLSRHGVVLLRSVDATTRERIDALNNGADCVLASSDHRELVTALAAVLRRSRTTRLPDIVSAGEVRINRMQRIATAAGRTLDLTPLEFDLLSYLVTHAGTALSRDRLLEDVWGYDVGGRETVTVHVRRLRCKLEEDPSRPTRLQTVWGVGYRLTADFSPAASRR